MYQDKIHRKWTTELLKEIDLATMVKEMAWHYIVMIYGGFMDHSSPALLNSGVHIIFIGFSREDVPHGVPLTLAYDVLTCYILLLYVWDGTC